MIGHGENEFVGTVAVRRRGRDNCWRDTVPIEPTFTHTGLNSPITEFALALAARRGDTFAPSGTAIVIAPYLALTAKHVIEDYWRRFETAPLVAACDDESGNPQTNNPGKFSILAYQVLGGGRTGQIWNVTKIVLSTFTDVAFLHLTHPIGGVRGYEWRGVKLRLDPPPVGARIVGFGYHSPRISVVVSDGSNSEIEWQDSPTTTAGEVLEIYRKRRDSSMLPFPCYRTSARFEHGMSGGPVFNDQGELCGLICAGGKTENDYYSHVTTLWPSMGTVMDIDRKGFPSGQSYPVLELARDGYIRAEGWQKVVLGADEIGHPVVGFARNEVDVA